MGKRAADRLDRPAPGRPARAASANRPSRSVSVAVEPARKAAMAKRRPSRSVTMPMSLTAGVRPRSVAAVPVLWARAGALAAGRRDSRRAPLVALGHQAQQQAGRSGRDQLARRQLSQEAERRRDGRGVPRIGQIGVHRRLPRRRPARRRAPPARPPGPSTPAGTGPCRPPPAAVRARSGRCSMPSTSLGIAARRSPRPGRRSAS